MQETQKTWVQSLGWQNAREKGMATHSRVLAWEIPWTKEAGGLQSLESQRFRHDLATKQQQPGYLGHQSSNWEGYWVTQTTDGWCTLDKEMTRVSRSMWDFILLLRMACSLKRIVYFQNFAFNIFGPQLTAGSWNPGKQSHRWGDYCLF